MPYGSAGSEEKKPERVGEIREGVLLPLAVLLHRDTFIHEPDGRAVVAEIKGRGNTRWEMAGGSFVLCQLHLKVICGPLAIALPRRY